MGLAGYRQKRTFTKTPEPTGGKPSGTSLTFVIQKHDASHLHYDFRLEMAGVLKSWAVPKGPSTDPEVKRLAMMVEDHPYDYRNFEGIIPKGQYGGGTVIIWDQGTYTPVDDKKKTIKEQERLLLKQLHQGKLVIRLKGKKLKGDYALVRSSYQGENSWLLIKVEDKYASKRDITKKDKSVVSGKTIAQMEKSPDNVHNSNRAAIETPAPDIKAARRKSQKAQITTGAKAAFPRDVSPMLATLTNRPFDDPGWIYEIKWDGYRALALSNKGKVELQSRNQKLFNKKFYTVHAALADLKLNAILDGEIVVINDDGRSDFGKLQNWNAPADGDIRYYVFDLLWLDGYSLIDLPLTERRLRLKEIIPENPLIWVSDDFQTTGTEFYQVASQMQLEGIMAKKADSPYSPGVRSSEWLKIKVAQRHEVVIGGYTRNAGTGKFFSSLLVGLYVNKQLKYTGKIGTGFSDKLQKLLLARFRKLETDVCPFEVTPDVNKKSRFAFVDRGAVATWLKPELVCEVAYTEMTSDGVMRHPSFMGMREDKAAREVTAEPVTPVEELVPPSRNRTRNKATEQSAKIPAPKSSKTTSKSTARQTSKKSPAQSEAVKSARHSKKDSAKPLIEAGEKKPTITINGKELTFSNPDKLYWPKEKITKRAVLNYYHQVAPYILPFLENRPQSLNRHPNGINGESFYQKNIAGKFPSWIKTHDYANTTKEGQKKFFVCTDEASLLYLANLGCIEINPWHSRVESPDMPDFCIIDLDPDTNAFSQVVETAQVVRKVLESIGVKSYPKTSGSTGIHIYIPLGAQYVYEQSKLLAELVVTIVHRELPRFTSLERSPAKRKGKIYLDFLQNRSIQTIAAPYSLRPKPGATVSMPLDWEEIREGLSIADFTIYNAFDRIRENPDLFKPVLGKGIVLENVITKLEKLF
ncbi:MAG: DNA ligase D [Chitinophagaceae bacterium]|nr:MAG: DNA ligase D [Chitinophagaceae bacterium]